jgi:CO/xanthine dehydrogenase Mo-binding subunit
MFAKEARRCDGVGSGQGIFFLRGGLAQLLQLPDEAVEVRYVEAAGCYGHNAAADAAADAALLSQAVDKPVRVQWLREQEHGWDPKGPAMVMTHAATLDDSKAHVASWTTEAWSPSHSARSDGGAGSASRPVHRSETRVAEIRRRQ